MLIRKLYGSLADIRAQYDQLTFIQITYEIRLDLYPKNYRNIMLHDIL